MHNLKSTEADGIVIEIEGKIDNDNHLTSSRTLRVA